MTGTYMTVNLRLNGKSPLQGTYCRKLLRNTTVADLDKWVVEKLHTKLDGLVVLDDDDPEMEVPWSEFSGSLLAFGHGTGDPEIGAFGVSQVVSGMQSLLYKVL